MAQHWIQCRLVKAPVVVDPTSQHRIKHARNIFQRLIRFQLQPPLSNSLPHGLAGLVANPRCEVYEELAKAILRPAWSECIPQKVKLYFRAIFAPIVIFAINYVRFVRMQFKSTFQKTALHLF